MLNSLFTPLENGQVKKTFTDGKDCVSLSIIVTIKLNKTLS